MSLSPRRGSRRGTAIAIVFLLFAGLLGATPTSAEAANTGHIKGTITLPKGVVTYNLFVQAYRFMPDVDGGVWGEAGETHANDDGTYDLSGLATGNYRIEAQDFSQRVVDEFYNNAYTVDSATTIAVTSGKTVTGKNMSLATGAHIKGKVTNSAGKGIGLVHADVYALEGGTWKNIKSNGTNADGTYDVGGLRAGTYRLGFAPQGKDYLPEFYNNVLTVDGASSIILVAAQSLTGRNATLTTASHVKGTLTTDSGDPVDGGAQAFLKTTDGEGVHWVEVSSTGTDANGNYDIGGLTAGTYRLKFYDRVGAYVPEYWNDSRTMAGADDIVVGTSSTVSGKDAVLTHLGYVAGSVTDQGGVHVGGVIVTAYQQSAGDPSAWNPVGTTTTVASVGGTTVSNYGFALPPGPYRFGFEDPTGVHVGEFYSDATTVDSAANVNVVYGNDEPFLHTTLISGGISGKVVNSLNEPVEQCAITAQSEDPNLPTQTVKTGAKGTFGLFGLSTGLYRVTVSPGGACGAAPAYYAGSGIPLSSDPSGAATIPVTTNQTTALSENLLYSGAPLDIVNTSLPSVPATMKIGDVYYAWTGAWLPSTVHFDYQWRADGVDIPLATSFSYTIRPEDGDKRISVRVTASRTGYTASSAESLPSDPVEVPNVWASTRSVVVDSSGDGTVNVSCTKACSGWAQVWSDADGTKKSEARQFTLKAGGWTPLKFTGIPYVDSATAKVRIAKTTPNEAPNPQFNSLTLTKKIVPPNVWATTTGITVNSSGDGTVNVSCTKACSGWAQVWSDADGTKKSEAKQFTLKAGGWTPLKFTSLPYVTSTAAKVRIAKTTPNEAPNPQFNNLNLTKK